MSYWKWLRGFIKSAVTPGKVKGVLMSPIMEFLGGFVMGGFFLGFGLSLGIDVNLYYLLLLGLIPSILITLHGQYRDELSRKGR